MSVFQIFHKGTNYLVTPWSKSQWWSWFISVNEGGGPVNFAMGRYRKPNPKGQMYFFYAYCFGRRFTS